MAVVAVRGAAALRSEAPLTSAYWYKVRGLRPRLRPGVRIARHVEQGQVWFVLSSPETGRQFRYAAPVHAILGAFDGRRSLDEIWQAAAEALGDDLPTQDEVIRLLGQLHRADALSAGSAPVLDEMTRRGRDTRRREALQRVRNPLFLRLPLIDPDRFLSLTVPLVRPVFSGWGLAAWLGLAVWTLWTLALHWEGLTTNLADRVLGVENLLVLAVVFPLAKLVHELAHGYAVKVWGGEVRDMGLMFLIFVPIPYVDASASIAFPQRRRRIVVAAAGMMAELVLAALALQVWAAAEPGLIRAMAFNMLVVAGVSTVFFNGNPLLRFDAYYILVDLIGVQNLGGRAAQWWSWLVHRWGFGLPRWPNPARSGWEARWFAAYQPLSWVYRLWLSLTIALFVASQYLVVGMFLAVWSVALTLFWPLLKGLWGVATGPAAAARRGRAIAVCAAMGAAGFGAVTLAPVPHGTVVEGVVWVPDRAPVMAGVDGVLVAVLAQPGERVPAGAPLLRLDAPLVEAEARLLAARVATGEAQFAVAETRGASDIAVAEADLGYRRAEADARRDDREALSVAAISAGRFVLPPGGERLGRMVRKGETLGYLLDDRTLTLRVAIPLAAIDDVRTSPEQVSVRFADRPQRPVEGHVLRLSPEATRRLPSPALTLTAGGPFALDPTDPEGRTATEPFHLAEIVVLREDGAPPLGARVHVRFDHGTPPLAPRLWRALRQTFLARLNL